jgi:O-acetyl-ADP-ribose deacetylase (regulator of RNase III)
MRITVLEGDITAQQVDAVVNAANRSLLGGGGVDGAIHRRGGPAIVQECRRLRETDYPDGLPTGQAVATTAGRLPAQWVIHTVGPVWSGQEDRSALLRSCYREALRLAADLGAATVAFPAISCGIYGWPLDDGARQALAAVQEVAEAGQGVPDEVRFVLFGASAFETFRREAQALGIG